MASYLDQFSEESLLVIKKPPVSAPTIQPITIAGDEDFLEERFISFAYRYRYQDGEYSATSQFSEPSFIPNSFDFSLNSYLNEGMTNSTNACIITFNSGGPLVVGIDLLFKESNNSIIKVIEKLDKANLGYSDNQDYTYTFSNSKIFTVLPESEILRLYDNVPLLAQGQTVMGNRLIYGNYVEGYDLIDLNKAPVKLEYSANLVAEEIGNTTLNNSTVSANYTIPDTQTTSVTVPNSLVYVDLSGAELIAGASITIDLKIEHNQFARPFGGQTPLPTETTTNVNLSFTYVLPTSYGSVYELATSADFLQRIGTAGNIETVANSCNGTTFTDQFNCELPENLDSLTKYQSGITSGNQPLSVIAVPGSSQIGIQVLAMAYTPNIGAPIFIDNVYEYYSINFVEATYQKIANPTSLHSNRGYEIGIVYMDEFNRSSTALVSPDNTVQIPCANSASKNSIQVTIPTTQVAPSWATRYKFVIKPDEDTYDTIYSNVYFEDPSSNAAYFLLEGESAAKVEDGDRLIVKSDINGPTQNCVYTTVLEKEVQEEGFLTIPTGQTDPVTGDPINVYVPGGPYMKLNPNNFSIVTDTSAGGPFVIPGPREDTADRRGENPLVNYPVNIINPVGTGQTAYMDYTIPAGARIKIDISQTRTGRGSCPARSNVFKAEFVSTETYANFEAWWVGDNIGTFLVDDSITSPSNYTNVVLPSVSQAGAPTINDIQTSDLTNYYQFYTDTTSNQTFLMVTGPDACASASIYEERRATVNVNIEVIRFSSTIAFETIPADALPDVWYENNLSFQIGGDGGHTGNVQSQNFSTSQPAIIDTGFYNCYAFGNGVESYKIRDSISGKQLNLGDRVTSTSSVDYKRAHRFADLTYSGVFNDETNVNKLNEFNLGLLNFKPLEESFGSIQKLFARETDILTLQEDKISYVLRGKNLLSDAAGTSTLTSVPEVLGLQIARIENYGISSNPESFVSFGPDKFFTDAKRGALIQLKGGNYKDEQLVVISEAGMRSWFRDLFIESPDTQKLGGFDPYMNEYVLSSNQVELPKPVVPLSCGVSKNLTVSASSPASFTLDMSELVGTSTVTYTIPFEGTDNVITELSSEDVITETGIDIVSEQAVSGTAYVISVNYNGKTYSSGNVFVSGSFTFPKDVVNVTEAVVTVSTSKVSEDTVDVMVSCPVADVITIYNVAVTNNNEAGQFIHNEYRWTDGTFTSPLHSNLVTFASGTSQPLVSQYTSVSGPQGAGIIPGDGANVTITSNKKTGDNFVFDANVNKLKYLRTNTLYQNNSSDINSLLASSTNATPIITTGAPNVYSANFVMPGSGSNLYIIWDYRKSTVASLCYSTLDAQDACCNCTPTPTPVPTAPTPVPVAPSPTPPAYRTISLSNPPGNNTTSATCSITTGLTYYINYSFAITNGLAIYTDTALTTKLYTSDPLAAGYTVWLKDTGGNGAEYAVDFDSNGNVDTVFACPPAPTPTPVPVAPTPSGLYYVYNSCDPSYGAVSVFLSTPPAQTGDRRYRISSNSYFVYDGNPGTITPTSAVETLQFTGQAGCI